ncbi:hypothetical protein MTO96_015112 [Rhipicephalus appendiculatus]
MAAAVPAEVAHDPNERLVIYWDPRYHSYFYAGVRTPPMGQFYDFTGAPVALDRDTPTWSVVHLEQVQNVAGVTTRPIIIERDEQVREILLEKDALFSCLVTKHFA